MYFYYNKNLFIIQVERRDSMIIGICGKSGSGKTTLAKKLEEIYQTKTIHVEIDKIGHQAIEEKDVREKLVSVFGTNILTNGRVDRKKLRILVYSDEEKMALLTKYTWEYMRRKIEEIIQEEKENLILLDWILLQKTEFFKECDLTFLLDVPYEERKRRVLKRDGLTEEEFALRDSAAPTYNEEDFTIVLKGTEENEIRKVVKKV